MIEKMKQLFTDSFAFAFATMGNKFISFLLLPVYTNYLEPSEFGVWDVTNTFTMLVTYLCILGTDAALAFYYFDVKDEKEKRSYFSSAVLYSVGMGVVFLLFFGSFKGFFAPLLYGHSGWYQQLIILALFSTVEAIFIQQMLAFARYIRRVWIFNIMTMIYWIGSSLLNVFFLVILDYGVLGIFMGQAVGGAITAILLWFLFYNQFTFKIKKDHLVHLIRYGAPLVPSLLSFWVMNSLSRPLIYHLVSPSDAGIFGAAVRVASFVALITSAFQLAWRPFAMSIKDREDAPRIFSIIGRALLVFGTLAIFLLSLFIKPIMAWITAPEYVRAYPIVWVLSLSTLLNSFYVVVSVGLLITKKTKKISQAFLIGTTIYLLGNIWVIPLYSFFGTAAVTLIAYLFVVYYIYFKARECYDIPFKMNSISLYLVIYLCIMVGITYLQVQNYSFLWIYYIIAFIGVILSIFISKVFNYRSLFMVYKWVQARSFLH